MNTMDKNTSIENKQIINRIHCIKGHVNAVEKMLIEDRPYDEIIFQLEAIRSAVAKTTSVAAQHYANTCISETLQNGDKNIEALKKPIEILMRVSQYKVLSE
ncbi:metal-sensitive transcriptional regulator [Desulfitobacterium sp. AusDCA]